MTYITSLKIGFSEPLDSVSNVSINVQAFFCRFHTLFAGPPSIFFLKTTLKLSPTVLFTHLKIILL